MNENFFFLFFAHTQIPSGAKVAMERANCSKPAPWINVSVARMYKSERKLLYPVNVGRNVARESAPTHYVLASDIELYPSPNLPAKFLEMIRRNEQAALRKPNPKVFVLSIFEVDEKSQPPDNKTALVSYCMYIKYSYTYIILSLESLYTTGDFACGNRERKTIFSDGSETRILFVLLFCL